MSYARRFKLLALTLLAPFFVTACINPGVKVLGSNAVSLSPSNTATTSSFSFKFALLNTAAATPNNLFVFLQGNENTSSFIVDTCNFSGTGCKCVFENAAGTQIGTTSTTTISYDSTGNYLRCQADPSITASIAKVYVTNIAGTASSSVLTVKSTLTASDLLGTLSASRLVSVYKYYCNLNYLQKTGTTAASFDCTAGALNEFVFPFNYYVWGGTYSSAGNFGSKPTDILYGGPTGILCGMQINQEDCTVSTPALSFGLYGASTGIFSVPISMTASPSAGSALYGYAAPTSTFTYTGTAYTVCPPGLSAEIFYQATPAATDFVSSNVPSGLVDTIAQAVSTTTTTPTLNVYEYTGGSCGSVTTSTGTVTSTQQLCKAPTSGPGIAHSYSYSSNTQTQFCVIPASAL